MACICVKQDVILQNKRKWRLQDRLDNWLFVLMHRSISARTKWPQGIQKITRISDIVLPFLAARGRNLNLVCTNELKMATAVINEFTNKVEVSTFIGNGVQFYVTVRVSPIHFTNSCLSNLYATVSITWDQKTDFSQIILQTRHLQ